MSIRRPGRAGSSEHQAAALASSMQARVIAPVAGIIQPTLLLRDLLLPFGEGQVLDAIRGPQGELGSGSGLCSQLVETIISIHPQRICPVDVYPILMSSFPQNRVRIELFLAFLDTFSRRS